jgi:hypothetical protein
MGERYVRKFENVLLSFNLVLSADFIPEFSETFLSYRSNFPENAAGRMIKEMNIAIEIPIQHPVSLIFKICLKNRRLFRPTKS